MRSSAPARVSVRHRAVLSAWPRIALVAALAAWAALPGAAARAASPSPEPADPYPTVETWLDTPVPDPAAPPDANAVPVAATLWDVRNRQLFEIDGLVAKLYPAKGSAKPTTAKAASDAPGHLIALLPIPKGGPGRVEIVTQARECAADGTCRDQDIPLRIAGTGPPPDAPMSALVRAQTVPGGRNAVAGAPAKVTVQLAPIGMWSSDAFQLPERIVVTASLPGDPDVAHADLLQTDPAGIYSGSLVVPRPGEVTLHAGIASDGGAVQDIAGDIGTLLVGGTAVARSSARPVASAGVSPPAAAASGDDGGPPWMVIGAIAVLALGLVLFLGEPLTRRFRRDPDRPQRP